MSSDFKIGKTPQPHIFEDLPYVITIRFEDDHFEDFKDSKNRRPKQTEQFFFLTLFVSVV